MPETTAFSDASGQQNHLGAAAVALNENLQASESRQVSIGSMEHWSVYAAELMAIFYAISLVLQVTQKRQSQLDRAEHPATILSDSMSALQAIRNPSNKSGQRIIRAILQAASEMKARGIPIRLQWVPGHCNDPGNDEADRLAKEAQSPNTSNTSSPSLLLRSAGAFVRLDEHRGHNRDNLVLHRVYHTIPHFLDRVSKVADAGVRVPAATAHLGLFLDKGGVDDLQLTVFFSRRELSASFATYDSQRRQ
ncbi:hypothetical protein CBS147323_11135 [Aspergillus niger]|nr:hypothetical protein CBS147323_11135 [Aspergillus niger]